jgi:hypothetical protein
VNLRDLCEFEFCRGGVRSVLSSDEMVARTVGIGARKGEENKLKLTVCQVVTDKCRVVNEMRDRSNA